MRLEFKLLHESAKEPKYATEGACGFDLSCVTYDVTEHYIEYGTGVAVSIPEGYAGLLMPRSSITTKPLVMGNSVGLIDCDYTGEIRFRFKLWPGGRTKDIYTLGERCGQLVIVAAPRFELQQVDHLNSTVRAAGGFGSSGT